MFTVLKTFKVYVTYTELSVQEIEVDTTNMSYEEIDDLLTDKALELHQENDPYNAQYDIDYEEVE